MEHKEYLAGHRRRLREELLRYSLPLWAEHGPDREHGGIFTCFDRQWRLTSHDKSGWQQGRAAWTFSRYCNQYDNREDYLQIARSCLDFIEAHLVDPSDGKLYFVTAGDGAPARKRRFSYRAAESFAIIGWAEYAKATGDKAALQKSRERFLPELMLRSGQLSPPPDSLSKYAPSRATRSFGQPMIFLDVCDVLLQADPENGDCYRDCLRSCCEEISRYFIRKDLRCALENVGPNGEFLSDWTLGREVNPGHGLEGVWFMIRAALTLGDDRIIDEAKLLYDFCIERGWDHEYGGIPMFVDALGHPPEKYEHDMKFWWVIDEAICAALTLYRVTGEERYLRDFGRFADYYFTFFADPEYGGCYGYLRRDGHPTEPAAKGNLFKGPFHHPRMLMHTDKLLGELLGE